MEPALLLAAVNGLAGFLTAVTVALVAAAGAVLGIWLKHTLDRSSSTGHVKPTPTRHSASRTPKVMTSQWRTYWEAVARWAALHSSLTFDSSPKRRRILQRRLDETGTTRGLAPLASEQLARFVFNVEEYRSGRPKDAHIRASRQSPTHDRKLNAQAEKFKNAFRELQDCWHDISSRNPLNASEIDSELQLSDHLESLSEAIENLPLPFGRGEVAFDYGKGPDLSSTGLMCGLFAFFNSECGLGLRESEIRTGLLGNEFWDWNVKVRTKHDGEETSRGCEAVRKAVKRKRHHA